MEKVPSRIKSQVGSVDIAVIMRGRDEEEGEIYRTQRKCIILPVHPQFFLRSKTNVNRDAELGVLRK